MRQQHPYDCEPYHFAPALAYCLLRCRHRMTSTTRCRRWLHARGEHR